MLWRLRQQAFRGEERCAMVLDITRELTNAPVYPGDPAPRLEAVSRMAYGDSCKLSVLPRLPA